MAISENGKLWLGRILVSIQLIAWCAVSALLLHRGIQNVQGKSIDPNTHFNHTDHASHLNPPRYRPTGTTAGIIMIVIASLMFILSPVFLIFKWVEAKKRHQRFLRVAQSDEPPKYEDVIEIEMERAPKYSTLFPPDPKLLQIPEKHRAS